MRCKVPYNENFVVFAKKHAGGSGNLIINFAWPYAKIDCTIFTNVGVSLISLLSLTLFVFNHKRHSSDVEPNYISIFRLIQSVIYPVGMSKDCSCFMQLIDYNSKDFVQILTKIGTNNCLWAPYKCTRF